MSRVRRAALQWDLLLLARDDAAAVLLLNELRRVGGREPKDAHERSLWVERHYRRAFVSAYPQFALDARGEDEAFKKAAGLGSVTVIPKVTVPSVEALLRVADGVHSEAVRVGLNALLRHLTGRSCLEATQTPWSEWLADNRGRLPALDRRLRDSVRVTLREMRRDRTAMKDRFTEVTAMMGGVNFLLHAVSGLRTISGPMDRWPFVF